MTDPVGGPAVLASESLERTPQDDIDLVRRALSELNDGKNGLLRIHRPRPTAAFSPRDATSPNFAMAADAVRSLGFEPVTRMAGGHLAIYDSNALVIDLVAAHTEPRTHVLKRFELLSKAIVSALVSLSVDARPGPLDGEYCPGEYSVNGEGRIKLAGLAQRISRRGYHLGAVISVNPSDDAKRAIAHAYNILGIPFDPATFGAIADLAPNLSFAVVRDAVLNAIAEQILPALTETQ